MTTSTGKGRIRRPAKNVAYQRGDGKNVGDTGEGLYQRSKDGLWVAAFPHTDPLTGKRVTKQFASKDPQEALSKRARYKESIVQGLEAGAEKQTVGDFLQAWLEYQVKPAARPSTLISYTQVVNSYILPTLGARILRDLQPEHVELMMRELRERISTRNELLSPRTVAYARAILRKALNHALRRGRIARNVVTLTDPPKTERKQITVPTQEHIRALLHAVEGHPYEPLYRVSTMLGLRIGEVLGLSWEDINFGEGELTINRALQRRKGFLGLVELKTERSRRTLLLPPSLIAALSAHRARQVEAQAHMERWRGNDWNLVFVSNVGTALEPRNVTRHYKAILQAAGLPNFRIHDLRHAYATSLARHNVHPSVAMFMLGHSQISQTMEVYTHVERASLREVAALVEHAYATNTLEPS